MVLKKDNDGSESFVVNIMMSFLVKWTGELTTM
jgi:hypothetical protein